MDKHQNSPSRVYGRRKGRPLRVRKARLMEDLLPRLLITLKSGIKAPIQDFFMDHPKRPLWLEIGFGGGEHLAVQAKMNPHICFIGCEPFVNGVASLLDHLDREKIENVRIFNDDARLICDALAAAALDKCF